MESAFSRMGKCIGADICSQLLMKHDTDRSGTISINEFQAIVQEVEQWNVSVASDI